MTQFIPARVEGNQAIRLDGKVHNGRVIVAATVVVAVGKIVGSVITGIRRVPNPRVVLNRIDRAVVGDIAEHLRLEPRRIRRRCRVVHNDMDSDGAVFRHRHTVTHCHNEIRQEVRPGNRRVRIRREVRDHVKRVTLSKYRKPNETRVKRCRHIPRYQIPSRRPARDEPVDGVRCPSQDRIQA